LPDPVDDQLADTQRELAAARQREQVLKDQLAARDGKSFKSRPWRRRSSSDASSDSQAATGHQDPSPDDDSSSDGSDSGSTGATPDDDDSSPEDSDMVITVNTQTPWTRFIARFTRHTRHVNEAYAAKMEGLEVFRGKAMRPVHTRWYHLLKPRLLVFYLIYAVNLGLRYVFGRFAPHWYAVVRPGLLERWLLAVKTIRQQQFTSTKFVAVYSLKGGIGKTTLTLLLAMFYRRVYTTSPMLVEDCNLDSGTLGSRTKLSTARSMTDAIMAVDIIDSLATLMTYCSRLKSGLLVMIMGDQKVKEPDDLRALHEKFKAYLGLVFMDLGTSTLSPSNQVALEDAGQVVIPTTPAGDSIEQAAKTLVDMIRSTNPNERELARTAVIAINRWWSFWSLFTSPKKVRLHFIDAMAAHTGITARYERHYRILSGVNLEGESRALPTDQEVKVQERLVAKAHERAIKAARGYMLRYHREHLDRVRFTVVGSSLWLALGRRVSYRLVGLRTAVQVQEINAMAAQNMSDNVALRTAASSEVAVQIKGSFPNTPVPVSTLEPDATQDGQPPVCQTPLKEASC